MAGYEKKYVVRALILAIAAGLCFAPLLSDAAGNRGSLLEWHKFLRSLEAKPGVLYLVSPEIIQETPGPRFIPRIYIESVVRRRELGHGYIIIYGDKENIGRRAKLAIENMGVIRAYLSASSVTPGSPGEVTDDVGFGGGGLDMLFEAMSSSCHMKFLNWPRNGTVWGIGKKLSPTHSCVGFGVVMGLIGYRVLPGKNALAFQQVLSVKQGALINPNAGQTPPHTPGQEQ